MDHYCNKCSSKTKLIKKSEVDYGCPRCHSQFELNNGKIVTAQFGGNIAKPTMYGPGSSPLFKGLSNKNRGTNTRFETSFDSIMSRSHNPAPIDPERNVEKRLEQFHVHAEEDRIPYELDIKERAKLKVRKDIRRREKFYEDAAHKVEENSVHYIKTHFQPSEKQMKTLEESLADRRKYEKTEKKSINEDLAHDQIKPARRHTVARTTPNTTVFDSNVSDTDADYASQSYNPRFLNVGPFDGVYEGTLLTNKQLDKYLDVENTDLSMWLNKTTNAFDYPELDDQYSTAYLSSDIPNRIKFKFNPSTQTIEQGLDNLLDNPKTETLPQIKAPEELNIDKKTNKGKEPRNQFFSYPIAPVGTTPVPPK
jgi:hypothetical protein